MIKHRIQNNNNNINDDDDENYESKEIDPILKSNEKIGDEIEKEEKKRKEFKKISKDNKLDIEFLKRLKLILKILFSQPLIPILLIGILFGLAIGQTYLSQFTGIILSNIYESLTTGNSSLFYSSLIKGFIFVGLSGLLDATIKFLVNILAWRWRNILCIHLQDQYFSHNIYYKIMALNENIDNPDQRITNDIDQFTSLLSNIVSQCMTLPMVVIYYTYLTYQIGWYVPVVVYAYFFLGYFITNLIMSPMVAINYLQDKLEGDFRYLHQRIRNFAESIALQNLSKKSFQKDKLFEDDQAKYHFDSLLENKKRVIFWQYSLTTVSDLFAYLAPNINYLIIGIPVFILKSKKVLEASDVTIQSYNCIMLASGFSQYINVTSNVSDLTAFVSRISSMIQICLQFEKESKQKEKDEISSLLSSNEIEIQINDKIFNGQIIINKDNNNLIDLNSLSFFTPKGLQLFSNISVLIEQGQSLLIMGPSGIGKSSLIRVIHGLWPSFNGKISKPPSEQLFYLSQQSYLIFGSLEEQILYPYSKKQCRISKQDLWDLFELLDLTYLLMREKSIEENEIQVNDLTHNWLNSLSPGEQQLISILRLIYHKPIFALLDESTSSIPQIIEEKVYQLLKQSKITPITIGHRSSLLQYHTNLLTFDKDKNWKLELIQSQ